MTDEGSRPQHEPGAGIGPDHPAPRRRVRGWRSSCSDSSSTARPPSRSGLVAIITSRDTLLTDYFGIGGIGAGCVNAGLLTLCACLVYDRTGAKMTGASVACLFLVLGFALFGKNLLNVWPIVFGVSLYSRFKGETFATNINTAFFGVALAPIFSEILFSGSLTAAVSVPLALATGLVIGFVLPPAAAQLFKAHMGFSLYNMGFTAGLVGTLVVALYKSYGFVPDPVFIWTTGNNLLLGSFLALVFASMIAVGFAFDRQRAGRAEEGDRDDGPGAHRLHRASRASARRSPTWDCAARSRMAYILAVGGDLNGPVIGAIFTIVGFAAFGKHPRNIVPIMAGVFLGSLAKPWNVDDPSILLAALFGTTLAPIAGRFGWHWGVVAGFVHSSAALTVGPLHAGLNLYNNGFAAGIVASVLVPVIMAIQSRTRRADEPASASDATPPTGARSDKRTSTARRRPARRSRLRRATSAGVSASEAADEVEADQRRQVEVVLAHEVAGRPFDTNAAGRDDATIEVQCRRGPEIHPGAEEDRRARDLADAIGHRAVFAQPETRLAPGGADAERPPAVELVVEFEAGRAGRSGGQRVDQPPVADRSAS